MIWLQQAWKYFIVSLFALVLDSTIFILALKLGSSPWLAVTYGFVLGCILAYLLSKHWVFKHTECTTTFSGQELIYFFLIGVIGLLVTQSVVWFLIEALNVFPLYAKLTAACLTFCINFLLRKILIFEKNKPQKIIEI